MAGILYLFSCTFDPRSHTFKCCLYIVVHSAQYLFAYWLLPLETDKGLNWLFAVRSSI